MKKPQIVGWEITTNEKGVAMGTLPAEQLRCALSYIEELEQKLNIANVGRSLPTDEEINDMVMWLDKRCGFDDHQKDYVFFGLKQMAKKVIGQ